MRLIDKNPVRTAEPSSQIVKTGKQPIEKFRTFRYGYPDQVGNHLGAGFLKDLENFFD